MIRAPTDRRLTRGLPSPTLAGGETTARERGAPPRLRAGLGQPGADHVRELARVAIGRVHEDRLRPLLGSRATGNACWVTGHQKLRSHGVMGDGGR